MARRASGIYRSAKDGNWKVDKETGSGRLRASFGTDFSEAEAWLLEQLAKLTKDRKRGRSRHTFEEAAAHYIQLYEDKPSIVQEIAWLKELKPFIGDLPLDRVYDGTLKQFIDAQRKKPIFAGKSKRPVRYGVKSNTINLKLGLVRHILIKAARSWRDDEGETWLPMAPLISMVDGGDQREPRQLTWQEQLDHLKKLPGHLQKMALFMLQCGCRDEVVCSLKWEWLVEIPELGKIAFIVPPESVKGRRGKKTSRVLVCNSVAQDIIEGQRGQHPVYVFTYQHNVGRANELPDDPKDPKARRPADYQRKPADRIETMNNTAWQKWRERCGLGDLHVHDLRHTVGMRLREAGVPESTIADILWHKRKSMTAHYSVAQVMEIFAALEKIKDATHGFNKSLATLAREKASVPAKFPEPKNTDEKAA